MYRLVLVAFMVGCYSPSYDNCSIDCTTTGCPNSYECDSQLHVCRRSRTTCEPGGGDAGRDSGGAGSDAPGPTTCALVQHMADGEAAGIFHIAMNPMIAQGNFVVVTIGQNSSAPSQIASVGDQNATMFSRAALETEGDETSAIYYLPAAPAPISEVQVTWTSTVSAVIDVSEWHCTHSPSFMTTAMAKTQISGTSFSAGMVALAEPALVFGAIVTNVTMLPTTTTAGFTDLQTQAFTATNGITATLSAAYGFFMTTNDLDVGYAVKSSSQVAGTVAAFSASMTP